MTDGIISAAAAALAGMGVGGGGLMVIWLVLLRGYPAKTAQALNLALFILSAYAALPFHARNRKLPYHLIAFLIVSAIPGVLIGCRLAFVLPDKIVRKLFGGFFIVCGILILLRRKTRSS